MATAANNKPTVDSLVATATMHVRSGNPADAIDLFRQAASLQPRNAQLLNNLGYTYQLAGQPAEAIKAYQKALKRAPKDTLTLCNLGLLQKKLGLADDALATFNRAIAFDPNDVNLLCNRGNLLLESGHAEQALKDYNNAYALAPDNPSVLNGRAGVLTDLMQLDAARADLDRAVQLRPDYATAWSNRGDVCRDQGDVQQATECYHKALSLQPGEPKTLANLAGLSVMYPENPAPAIEHSHNSLNATISAEFADAGPSMQRCRHHGVSLFRLRHDLGQAQYLQAHVDGNPVPGVDSFVEAAGNLLAENKTRQSVRKLAQGKGDGQSAHVPVTAAQLDALLPFFKSTWQAPFDMPAHCLNPDNDWQALQAAYLAGSPEILVIDNFLSREAIAAMRHYCLASRVWIREYPNQYLGAFANQGFNTALHMRLAVELRERMPQVFHDYPLNQLWGFKYDTTLGKGINIHADFALVNLNFWITPDEFHLNKDRGGLKLYDVPAPSDWTFHDYNTDSQTMYNYLDENQSGCQVVPHRFNRAVLFNSALFHETDEILFADCYEGRRINITYLFGRQLG